MKKLIYLFIRGRVPSLLRLWLGPGVVRFAGSENMILSMVHVVETFLLKKKTSGYSEHIQNIFKLNGLLRSHLVSLKWNRATISVLD